MRVKWYISTLVLIVALFGLGQQQITVPNQEIVIKFANENADVSETQNTIAAIKAQLLRIGVTELQVHQVDDEGQLKISYYSDIDVSKIRQILSGDSSQQFSLNLPDPNQSQEQSPSSYNLDVYEIHKVSDSEIDLEGHVVELKAESDRFFSPNVFVLTSELNSKEKNNIEAVAYNVYGNLALTIDTISYQIPEVRAGPYTS